MADYVAAAFDYEGPAKGLLDQFSLGDEPYLAKTLAAFLYLQFEALGWDEPDYIIYVPQSFLRSSDRGYNASLLLAREFSRLIKKPVRSLFKKSSPTLPQRALVLKDRKQLSCENFVLKDNRCIEDKIFLLVDDLYVTGATAQALAAQLRTHHPKRTYVLTFCRG
jgi:ComF family protein